MEIIELGGAPGQSVVQKQGQVLLQVSRTCPCLWWSQIFVRWLHVPLWLPVALRRFESSMSLVLTASWPMSLGTLREGGVAAPVQRVYPARANELPPDRSQIEVARQDPKCWPGWEGIHRWCWFLMGKKRFVKHKINSESIQHDGFECWTNAAPPTCGQGLAGSGSALVLPCSDEAAKLFC